MSAATSLRRLNFRRVVLFFVLALFVWAFVPDLLFRPTRDPSYGLVLAANSPSTSRFAYATFLSGDADVAAQNDDYFRAARLLTYQLLHAAETRTKAAIPLVVLVTSGVPQWKRDRLSRDGATVVEAEDVPLSWWIGTGVTRWKDQFTKLRLLEMTQFDRILFIDADTLLTRSLDGVFEEPSVRDPSRTMFEERPRQVRWDEARLPASYVFAARSDNQLLGERAHVFPPGHTDVFTAGFWVAAPSRELYRYLMSVMSHWRRFDPHTMEQSLLNYAFRRAGAMPWTELDASWSATWPNEGDLAAGVATLHEKFWKTGPPKLRELYATRRAESEAFFAERDKTVA
ncbi:nucleotide-diphospho-sugar transferase [Plectosphaerella cucumerina]|uniref:Nucleotide-diphospho-sugar transferase n=1 Tax=Plectosphaerella cucumerina TaxID=40658 RepID=A0A8K0X707_9PEZI|nr:nucleotide-diphospho-sugar transferase [Plectosphaerella cucumerina]